MRSLYFLAVIFLMTCGPYPDANALSDIDAYHALSTETNEHVELSMEFLEGMRDGTDVTPILNKYAAIPLDDLVSSLNTKNKKLAFWINTYNAFVQHDLVNNPESFKDKKEFYKGQRHKIAGIDMSFDNMEHGIMRNSRVKISFGYLKRLFVKKWEKQLRNTDIDGRIHFMLNCGAKSCPPIAIFDDVGFDEQANAVVTRYLEKHTVIEGELVKTSPLFSWFRADFGGKSGMRDFLRRFKVIPDNDIKYKIEFTSYDWTLSTGNYSDL